MSNDITPYAIHMQFVALDSKVSYTPITKDITSNIKYKFGEDIEYCKEISEKVRYQTHDNWS